MSDLQRLWRAMPLALATALCGPALDEHKAHAAGEAPPPPVEAPAAAQFNPQTTFRLRLRLGHEWLVGLRTTPAGIALAFAIEPALRVTETVSVGIDVRYSLLRAGLSRVRWSATLLPEWRPWAGLSLGAGGGIAGLLRAKEIDPRWGGITVAVCDGAGPTATLRLRYAWELSDALSAGPLLQADWQRTHCQSTTTTVQRALYGEFEPRRTWTHLSVGAAWTVTWR